MSQMETFDTEEARHILSLHPDEMLNVFFYKRTNGERRAMRCKWWANLHNSHDEPLQRDLWPVVERTDDGEDQYRMINLRGVYRVEATDNIYWPGDPSRQRDDLDDLDERLRELF